MKWREDVGVAVEMRGAVSIPVSMPSCIVFVHFLPTPHGILSNSCPLVLVLFLNTQPVPTGPSLSLPASWTLLLTIVRLYFGSVLSGLACANGNWVFIQAS